MIGWSDLPADLGDAVRIARLSDHLPGDALVISSDLIRARATADAIAGPRTRLPETRDLREIHFGDWELQAFETIPDQTHLRAFWEQPGDIRAPGGESWHEVAARVTGAVDHLCRAHPGRDIIAVAHMGAILTQVQTALGITAYEAFGHKIDNLSVTELRRDLAGWHAEAINRLP